jgi:hypothetical protein
LAGTRIFIAVASVAVLALGGVNASGALTTSTERVRIDGFPDRDTAKADCRRGQRIVSGGFSTPTYGFTGQPRISPISSKKSGGRAWTSSAYNGDPSLSGRFTSYAYCERQARRLRERSAHVEFGGGESTRVRAGCRVGERLVSGGFSVPDLGSDEGILVTESRKAGQGWAAAARVTAGTGQELVVHAYCAANAPKLKTRRTRRNVGTGPPEQSARARCPRERPVVSGGFKTPAQLATVGVHESRRKGRRAWLATSYTFAPASGALLVVEAYCGPKRR